MSTVLYEPKEGDKIINVEGINFYLDKGVDEFKSDIEVFDVKKVFRFGEGVMSKYTG